MNCPSCGHENAADARFCNACGTALVSVDVEATGALNPVDALVDTGSGTPVVADGTVAVLIVHRGPNEGAAFTLSSPVVSVGRAADQNVFLDDITVSRRHAELRAVPDGWQIVDLGSLNGTYVNRKPVQEATLVSGDEVQIGKYRFRYMAGSSADRRG